MAQTFRNEVPEANFKIIPAGRRDWGAGACVGD